MTRSFKWRLTLDNSAAETPFKWADTEESVIVLGKLGAGESNKATDGAKPPTLVRLLTEASFRGEQALALVGLGIFGKECWRRAAATFWQASASRNNARAWNARTASLAVVIFWSISDGFMGKGEGFIGGTAVSSANLGCQRRNSVSSGSSFAFTSGRALRNS